MKNPEISVCIPCFNAENYISQVVASLESQSFERFSVTFVDDCSTDNTVALLTERLRDSPLSWDIQVRDFNSGGMGLSVQNAMASCKLPYFTWFGIDDELDPNYLQELHSTLDNDPEIDYAYCDFAIIDSASRVTGRWSWKPISYRDLTNHVARTTSGVFPMNGLFRMKFIRDRNLRFELPKGESFSSDTVNAINFLSAGMAYTCIQKPLFRYRKHPDQLSSNALLRVLSDIRVLEYIYLEHSKVLDIRGLRVVESFDAAVERSRRSNLSRFPKWSSEIKAFCSTPLYAKSVLESRSAIQNRHRDYVK